MCDTIQGLKNNIIHSFYTQQNKINHVKVNDQLTAEVVAFSINRKIDNLLMVDWGEDHLKETMAVMKNLPTTRYANYSECWRKGLNYCTIELLKNINSRRAIIHFTTDLRESAYQCLMTVQFLIRNEKLMMIANFRSWELSEFAIYDLCLLTSMADEMARHLGKKSLGELIITAGSAHINL